MNHSPDEDDENFYNDEYVDIIDPKAGNSFEGRIIAIKGDQLYVDNLEKRKGGLYNKNDKKIIKQWSPGKRIKKFNRIDFQLKGTDYWVVGVVVKIMPNNKILIRYKNNNNFKPIVEEIVDINDKRIAKVGLYTKFDGDKNKLLSSTVLNLGNSSLNNIEINTNSNHKNILNNKRKRSNENKKTLTNEDEEEDFQILLLQSNLQIKEVKGDGNCLFRAVSDQVYGTDQYYELLREKCMDYLVIMRRFFEPYIGENFDEYIKEKRKNQTWGDDIELEALSEIYSRPVEIYKGSDKPLKTFHENKYYSNYDTNSAINFTLYPIRLSYHKGNHYNSIIPLETDVENYKKYKDSLITKKPGYFESKMIQNAEDNEAELDKGIQVSNDFFLRLKNNLSEKIKDIANKNNLSEDDEEEHEENIKNKKIKREENKEKNEENINNINKIDEEKETKNKNNENNSNDNDNFLSNSTIKSALELGYDYEDAIEAWELYGDNKELVINYLLNKNNDIN